MPAVKRTSSMMTPGGASGRYRKNRRVSRPYTTLGRIGGKVAPSQTTLAKSGGPFTGRKYMTFLYENALTRVLPAAVLSVLHCSPNSLYDFDKTGSSFGNKQPLYYDTMLTVSGPYKAYQVISWKTTYTIVNNSAVPITVFAIPPISATGEIDSIAEADNFPGVKRLFLTASSGSKNQGVVTVTGHQNDVFPIEVLTGNSTTANYAGDPGTLIYQGLIVGSSDGTTALDFYVAVKHEAYSELQNVDALVS